MFDCAIYVFETGDGVTRLPVDLLMKTAGSSVLQDLQRAARKFVTHAMLLCHQVFLLVF